MSLIARFKYNTIDDTLQCSVDRFSMRAIMRRVNTDIKEKS